MTMSNTLAGKIALITGAASGMGLETTKRFVEEGARVLAIDVLGDELCQLDEFTGVFALTADVTNEDDVSFTRLITANHP
jgi:NAD(P)-dependent dehydrogenase (short-subunit alcohol dehydrogenase family)